MTRKVCLRIFPLIALAFLLVLLYGFLHSDTDEVVDIPKVLGIVVTVTEDDWQDSMFASVTEHARQNGFEVMTMQAQRSQSSQIEVIRALIVYQVDAVMFFPVVDSGWDHVLSEAEKAAIPVITVDKGIRPGKGGFNTSYVGYDYYGDSLAAAKLLADMASDQAVMVELYGTLGSYPAKEITRGFRETLSEHGLQIQNSVCGDYMRSRGKEIVEGYLKRKDGVDFVISHNDAMTIGAVEAIEQEGKIPGKDVYIFAVGGGEETLEMFDKGMITCLIQRDTQAIGQAAMEAVNSLFAPAAPEKVSMLIETTLLSKEVTMP